MLTIDHDSLAKPSKWRKFRSNLFKPERFGQTLASVCWIVSMLVYGIESGGDWLQLCAASAWFLANMAAITGECRAAE
ncbi:MAG: hypothetical protein AAF541_00535 [Pseudomonadota bacterium]